MTSDADQARPAHRSPRDGAPALNREQILSATPQITNAHGVEAPTMRAGSGRPSTGPRWRSPGTAADKSSSQTVALAIHSGRTEDRLSYPAVNPRSTDTPI